MLLAYAGEGVEQLEQALLRVEAAEEEEARDLPRRLARRPRRRVDPVRDERDLLAGEAVLAQVVDVRLADPVEAVVRRDQCARQREERPLRERDHVVGNATGLSRYQRGEANETQLLQKPH